MDELIETVTAVQEEEDIIADYLKVNMSDELRQVQNPSSINLCFHIKQRFS